MPPLDGKIGLSTEELIKREMKKIYSEAVVEHSMDSRNLGEIEDANGFARVTRLLP